MTDKSSKFLQILLYVILAVSALLGILFYANVISDDQILYWGYLLLVITIVITIVAPLIYLIFNLKSAFMWCFWPLSPMPLPAMNSQNFSWRR